MYKVTYIYTVEDEYEGEPWQSTVTEDKEFSTWDEAKDYYDSLRNCPWISNIDMIDTSPDFVEIQDDIDDIPVLSMKSLAPTVQEIIEIEEISMDDVQILCEGVYLPVKENIHRKVISIVEPYSFGDKFVLNVYEE